MRIMSQDGMADLPYESIGICINYHNKTDIIAYPAGTFSPDDEYWKLAHYSTEDKARKAMDMLHEKYREITIYLFSDKNDFVKPKTFQFPADDEIEV